MLVFYFVIGFVLLFFVLSEMGPKSYKVERTIVIDRDKADIYQYVRNSKNQNDWGPWAKKDTNMTMTYTGTPGEVGFISAWAGNKEVGEGEQETTGLIENERVESEMRFLKPFKSVSQGSIQFRRFP